MQSGLGFNIEQEYLQTVTETVGGVPPCMAIFGTHRVGLQNILIASERSDFSKCPSSRPIPTLDRIVLDRNHSS